MRRRRRAPRSRELLPSCTAAPPRVAAAGVALFFTWRRLFVGMDLQDESYYVLVPWRWALGDRPFVQEQNLLQVPGLLTYPFVKLFGVLRGYDVTGLMLYTRHLYLLLMVAVAVVAFLFLRRLVRWQLALPAAAVYRHVHLLGDAAAQLQHDGARVPHAERHAERVGGGRWREAPAGAGLRRVPRASPASPTRRCSSSCRSGPCSWRSPMGGARRG